jgi:SAM-dependent methyltransferase
LEKWYRKDLAYIHDAGFSDFALGASREILRIFERAGINGGLIVDLGCGSGIWARELKRAGYDVLGIDISEAMIALARRRVPRAEFRIGSLFDAEIPPCEAVTALGECLSYLFDRGARRKLGGLFKRVYAALRPGGLFIFDVVELGQVPANAKVVGGRIGDSWVVLAEKEEDVKRRVLTRRIVSFRREGNRYRRADEVHRQRLYTAAEVSGLLTGAGFKVRVTRRYGEYRLLDGRAGFIARKPTSRPDRRRE